MKKAEKVSAAFGLLDGMSTDLETVQLTVLTDEQFDNQDSDEVYAAPQHITTDKNCHFYLIYAIVSIDNGTVYCKGMGEDWGDELIVELGDLSWSAIMALHSLAFGSSE